MMLKNRHRQSYCPVHSPSRLWLVMAAVAAACFLGACQDRDAAEPQPSAQASQAEATSQTSQTEQSPQASQAEQASQVEQPPQDSQTANLALEAAMKPWTGDLDAMIERRFIRVLTVYSKSFYFVDKGVQRGATHDLFRLFEQDLNEKLAKDNKLKQKHLKVQLLFIPVARGDLLPALAAGKGDIAAANLTDTEELL